MNKCQQSYCLIASLQQERLCYIEIVYFSIVVCIMSNRLSINRLSVKPQPCQVHHLPQAFLCLDPKCTSTPLLCSHCIKLQHNHYNNVVTLQQFKTNFQALVEKAKRKYDQDSYPLKIAELINSKKQEIERVQLELMELVMRRCSQQKKKMFEALQSIEKSYIEREHYFSKNHQIRLELIRYLSPLAKNQDLLELKLMTSSRLAFEKLKESLIELEKLSSAFSKKDVVSLQQIVLSEINLNSDLSFYKNIKQHFKQTIKSQPLLFFPHPPLKKYSFKNRNSPETPIARPQSSEHSNCKTKSLTSLRPTNTRSQIM